MPLRLGIRYIEKFASTVPDLTTAVMLIKLLAVLEEKSESDSLSKKIGNWLYYNHGEYFYLHSIRLTCLKLTVTVLGCMCGDFLKQQWYNSEGQPDKGAKCNELLQQLLKYVSTSFFCGNHNNVSQTSSSLM